jgi:hypothetical protein
MARRKSRHDWLENHRRTAGRVVAPQQEPDGNETAAPSAPCEPSLQVANSGRIGLTGEAGWCDPRKPAAFDSRLPMAGVGKVDACLSGRSFKDSFIQEKLVISWLN